MSVPVISFIGWSGSGKTTFIEKLIPILRSRGLRLAVIKHDGHEFQMDKEGKDTWRFSQAGAEYVAIANPRHSAELINGPASFSQLCHRAEGFADLIIAEGWTDEEAPQIEILRGHQDLRCTHPDQLIAIVTDQTVGTDLPTFGLEDVEAVADFIFERAPCLLPYAQLKSRSTAGDAAVTLTVDGKDVPLLPFVQDIIKNTCLGLVLSLKDTNLTEDSKIEITLLGVRD